MSFPPKFSLSYTFQTARDLDESSSPAGAVHLLYNIFLAVKNWFHFNFNFPTNFFKFLCPIRIVFNRIELLESNADQGGP